MYLHMYSTVYYGLTYGRLSDLNFFFCWNFFFKFHLIANKIN